MDIKDLQKNWELLGRTDPLWAVLTSSGKKGGGWDEAEFFRTGRKDIARLMAQIDALKIKTGRRRVLDFGCGVGRLTQAFCEHFERADGVDIAPSMIEFAKRYNRHGSRCKYPLNESNDLGVFADDSFDLVFSLLVLQHMKPGYARNYIREFIRVVSPDGLVVFQLPSELSQPISRLKRFVATKVPALAGAGPRMEMHGIPRREVLELIEAAGARTIDAQEDHRAGTPWRSYTYYVAKDRSGPKDTGRTGKGKKR